MILQQACIDDSGTGGSGIFALSGYVLPVEEWQLFADNWDGVLKEHPSIDCLKMEHAARGVAMRQGRLVRWAKKDRDLKLRKLVSVLRAHEVIAVESYVAHADYGKHIEGKLPEEYDNPYFFCFYDLIIGTLQHQRRRHPNWKVHFVFDDQGKLGKKVSLWYSKVKSMYSDNLQLMMGPTPDFRTDTDFNPLQAADALAWTTRRVAENAKKPKPFPIPDDILEGFYGVPTLNWHWDAERLSNFVLDSADILREIGRWKDKLKSIEGYTALDFKARSIFKR
jgi:hypothetical protein